VFVANESQPRDLVRQLKAFLEERTPFEWTIRASNEVVAPVESIAERRRREDERKLEELKRQPFVAEIVAVRDPPEDKPGDVVLMPQQKSPAASPRKKEAEK